MADQLSMLLAHTNGHEYDWMSPDIMKWRASRGETMLPGPTVEGKRVRCSLILTIYADYDVLGW
jgi:hypothetical protein